ncbi:MAG TPA: CsbD family protein [Gammaproteobacteria bacterium]|jgi:uncharacterized protein YjbJ (UPF0337 family)|nr:CsbD family protein [Gammaproteobacteria bacterium]
MNYDIIAGNWKTLKGKLHHYWGELTNNEIEQLDGSRESLTGLLQQKYGIAKNKAEDEIQAFTEEYAPHDFKNNLMNFLNKSLDKVMGKSHRLKKRTASKAASIMQNSPLQILTLTLGAGFIISRLLK